VGFLRIVVFIARLTLAKLDVNLRRRFRDCSHDFPRRRVGSVLEDDDLLLAASGARLVRVVVAEELSAGGHFAPQQLQFVPNGGRLLLLRQNELIQLLYLRAPLGQLLSAAVFLGNNQRDVDAA
jgi:hypothetical protein